MMKLLKHTLLMCCAIGLNSAFAGGIQTKSREIEYFAQDESEVKPGTKLRIEKGSGVGLTNYDGSTKKASVVDRSNEYSPCTYTLTDVPPDKAPNGDIPLIVGSESEWSVASVTPRTVKECTKIEQPLGAPQSEPQFDCYKKGVGEIALKTNGFKGEFKIMGKEPLTCLTRIGFPRIKSGRTSVERWHEVSRPASDSAS